MFVVTLPRSADNPLAFAKKAKHAGAKILEIRGDLTPGVRPFRSPLPLLISPRGRELPISAFAPAFVDLELSEIDDADVSKKTKRILSHHDFTKTPSLSVLKRIVLRLYAHKPWAVKIATTVRSYKDLQTLTDLQSWLQRKGVRSIILGMGSKAYLSRLLSPYKNLLTYATLDDVDPSAPGQLPLSLHALAKGRKDPKLFGILGGPHITASMSPVIHNALFQRHKIDALYSCFPSEDFSGTVRELSRIGVRGFSVTAPFKRDAFLLARTRHASAEALGVANTLRRVEDPLPLHESRFLGAGLRPARRGGWKAWNTDGDGIEHGYPFLASTTTLAILGAGGAVPSVIRAARACNPNVIITIFARDPKKAKRLLSGFSVRVEPLRRAVTAEADTVICAISQNIAVPMPTAKTAVDLRYGTETSFMADARKKGMKVYDGVPMLIGQALKQFQHFTGKTPYDDDETFLRSILTSFLSSHGR